MRNTLLITAIDGRFMSENGIVAVLGDENQFVICDIRIINLPLLLERGHIGQIRGNVAEPIMGIWLPRTWVGACTTLIRRFLARY